MSNFGKLTMEANAQWVYLNCYCNFKNHQFYRAQYYTIFNKVIDENFQNYFLQLPNKLLCI